MRISIAILGIIIITIGAMFLYRYSKIAESKQVIENTWNGFKYYFIEEYI